MRSRRPSFALTGVAAAIAVAVAGQRAVPHVERAVLRHVPAGMR